ncbi:MAG TPA: hypothetical protein RMG45_00815, partial [Polyangiaceae bacterium LLY-WYZ-15_(1-7)]|nr:hypothetical protein [Polyangiaceae bacterium LLY-WYZ-15_(1-7)]
MTEPLSNDQIVVHAEHSDEVVAERADLHVAVEGSRLSTGGEALAQVREVKAFVAALHQLGVDDVALEALQGRTTSGFLGRSSAATYMLRVRVRPGQLGEVLDVLASMEDVRLTRTEWRFPASADRQG